MADTFVAQVAADHRAAARQHLDWSLDQFRVDVGLAEVVDVPDVPLVRQTRRLLSPGVRMMLCHRPCAAYAHFHFVRDKS